MKPRQDIERLKKHLLKLGGKRFQIDEFLRSELSPKMVDKLLDHGKRFKGKIRMIRGADCECHANSDYLSEIHPTYTMCFGLALSGDGIWRIHSWCKSRTRIIETTLPRKIYFGCEFLDVLEIVKLLLGLGSGIKEVSKTF